MTTLTGLCNKNGSAGPIVLRVCLPVPSRNKDFHCPHIRCGLGGMDMISGTLRHRGMLFAAASVVAMGLAASPASAQSETAADEGTESEIVVTGFRASLENALNAKSDSTLIIDTVTEIGRASVREKGGRNG